MAMLRSQFPDILTPGFDMYFFKELKDYPEEYSKFIRLEKGNKRRSYRTTRMAGFGLAGEKPEGVDIAMASLLQGQQQEFVYLAYALGYEVSRELYEDEVEGSNVFSKAPQALARAMKKTVEYLAATLLDDLGTGRIYRAHDGLSVLHNRHTLIGSASTWANRPAVDIDISHTGLMAAFIALETSVDERNLIKMDRPRKLVISPEERFNVKRFLNSPLLPGGSNNDVNPLYDEDLKVEISHYKTDKDLWFVVGEENPLFCIWRTPLDFFEDEKRSSQVGMWYAYMRLVFGADDFRGIYGSIGA
ncbi:MAG: hypothetical protein DDT19_02763 [Syntrophomonadaceae bacterium]|nr:hypothetical protein [Bacillota bacterium]